MNAPIKILNAFSLNMVSGGSNIQTRTITAKKAVALFEKNGVHSCVGHADTAAVISSLLEVPIQFNRVSVELAQQELVVVAQYKGPRLPEGSTTLPEGAEIVFLAVYVGDQPNYNAHYGDDIDDVIARRLR